MVQSTHRTIGQARDSRIDVPFGEIFVASEISVPLLLVRQDDTVLAHDDEEPFSRDEPVLRTTVAKCAYLAHHLHPRCIAGTALGNMGWLKGVSEKCAKT